MDHDTNQPDWKSYNQYNRRHPGMSELWVRDLASWILSNGCIDRSSNVLDFGCGYFDLGGKLVNRAASIDGFDVDRLALEFARSRYSQFTSVKFFDQREVIPANHYQLIVVNSVMQYLGDRSGVIEVLNFLRTRLATGGSILVADLIPLSYSAIGDGLLCLVYATRCGYFLPMVNHLIRAIIKPARFRLLTLAPQDFLSAAKEAGLKGKILPNNLTPSRRRFSCLLSQ